MATGSFIAEMNGDVHIREMSFLPTNAEMCRAKARALLAMARSTPNPESRRWILEVAAEFVWLAVREEEEPGVAVRDIALLQRRQSHPGS